MPHAAQALCLPWVSSLLCLRSSSAAGPFHGSNCLPSPALTAHAWRLCACRPAAIGGVPAYRFGPARLQKHPAPSLMPTSAEKLASLAHFGRAHATLESPGAVPWGGGSPASTDSPAKGEGERLPPEGAGPSAVSSLLRPRDRAAGTRRQSGSSSLTEPGPAAAGQNVPEPLPSEGAGVLAVHASVQPSPPPGQSLTGCLPAEAGREGSAAIQLLRHQPWTGEHHCSGSGRTSSPPDGVQLPIVAPRQGQPERLPAAPGEDRVAEAGLHPLWVAVGSASHV